MMRTLHKDINAYNMQYEAVAGGSLNEEEQEETGWKLVHADVFRPPQRGRVLLSVFVGTGTQIIAVLFCGVLFALAGFLSPANRGTHLLRAVGVPCVGHSLVGAVAVWYGCC